MELVATLYTGVLLVAMIAASLWLAFLLFLAWYSHRCEPLPPLPEQLPHFLVLVPAHDEQTLIGDTVSRILATDYPAENIHLWVIADNCTDATAEKARQAGAHCLERHDETLVGKGYALDFALHLLTEEQGDAVLFLDADSRPDSEYFRILARYWARGDAVVQGWYDTWSVKETWFTRLTSMSFALRNKRVYPAFDRLGWPLPLRGSGMLFERSLINRIGWCTHGLTEDLEMSLQLIREKVRIRFASQARSGQYMPPVPSEADTQRQRWSAGERSFRRELLGKELPAALKTGQWGNALAFASMAAPSLSVQLLGLALLAVLAIPVSSALAVFGLALLGVYGLYVLSAAPAINTASLSALGMVPVYTLWRIGQGLIARLPGRGSAWQRTERPGEENKGA